MELYPFKLSSITKSPIWSGTRLLTDWGKKSDCDAIGESWELTVRKNEKSVIQNGVYAGRTLESVIQEFGGNLIAPDFSEHQFPLLVKLIDAGDLFFFHDNLLSDWDRKAVYFKSFHSFAV